MRRIYQTRNLYLGDDDGLAIWVRAQEAAKVLGLSSVSEYVRQAIEARLKADAKAAGYKTVEGWLTGDDGEN